ncbi:hypothetical protein D3C71_1332750 [compost metagenome]
MTKFTVDQYQDAKVKAKELGINFVGKTKQALVDLVNAEMEKLQPAKPAKKEKWYANGYGYTPGQKITIVSKTIEKAGVIKEILQGRQAVVVGPSANEGQVKALLIDPKTGETLNCPITLEIAKINKVVTINLAKAELVA